MLEFLASVCLIVAVVVVLVLVFLKSKQAAIHSKAYEKYVSENLGCWAPEEVEQAVRRFVLENFRVSSTVESIKYYSKKYPQSSIGIAADSVIHIHAVSRKKSDQFNSQALTSYVSHFNVVIDNANKEMYLNPSKI